jgi:hypothetical protein
MGLKNKGILTLMTLLIAFSVSCNKSKKKAEAPVIAPSPVQSPYVTPDIPGAPGSTENSFSPTDAGANLWSKGGTAPFVPVSNEEFNLWVASHPVDPKEIYINVNLKEVPTRGTYAGEVRIHYKHSTQNYEATLKSGTKTYDGNDYFKYNYWFNYQGKKVFSAFFEDLYGAIVLVVDKSVDLGDGGGASEIGGSVWYKNFTKSFATYDAGSGWSVVLPCWFRTIGPFDCRSFSVMDKSALIPNNGYIKLGTFTNMSKLKAFNLAQ